MQTGEVLRRVVFNLLDAAKGGKLKKLKEVNKREIVEGVTPEYMERRIDLLLDYVKKHSPYYKKHPEWTKLEDFPVMTKGDFLEHYEEVLVENSKEQGNLYRLSTSGSTGTPFTVLCDGDKMNRVNMNFISCMELNGFRLGMKRGEFRAWIKGKNTISMWKSFKNNLVMVDISNMGDDSLEKICKDIEKKKIQVLVTYSSALTALTGYIRRTGRDISKWKVEMVFSMGEALPDATYELTKEIFGYSPVRSYGNNENGFIITNNRSTEELINTIKQVIKDTEKLTKCSINNKLKIGKFELNNVLKDMQKIYTNITKKKVIHILNTNKYSGAENVAITIINNVNKNEKFKCLYMSPEGEISKVLKKNGIEYIPVKKLSCREIRRICKKYNPDIIHAHDFRASIKCALLKKNNLLIFHIHNNPPWIKRININSFSFLLAGLKADKILTVSKAIGKEYIFFNFIRNRR